MTIKKGEERMTIDEQSISKCLEQIKNIISNNISNAETFSFLYYLELDELIEVANVIETSFVDLDNKLFELIKFIDIETRIAILDDLYDNNIKNYEKYMSDKIDALDKYLDEYIKYINELFVINNKTNNDLHNNYLFISLEDKEKLINRIIEVCSSITKFKKENLENWNLFSSPKSPYSYHVIKFLVNDLKDCIIKVKTLSKTKNDYKKLLLDFANNLMIILEENTNLIINTNNIFKEKLSFEHYEILEKYNCLEKIGLIKYPSYCSIDLSDAISFFEDTKIVSIIDGEQENIINEGKPDKLIRVTLRSDFYELGINEIFNEHNFDLNDYGCLDLISYDGKGNNRKLIILLQTIK